jgi:DNA-binding response OmpR family regulator
MDSIPVLLVDDDLALCSSSTRQLAMEGLAVTAVHDAEAAINEATQEKYQLLILDAMLPGGDGRKVLRHVRLGSSIPVIMLTARGDEADRISGLEAGG